MSHGSKRVQWVIVLAVVAGCGWACSSDDAEPTGGGGAGGTAGEGVNGGKGGSGGKAGTAGKAGSGAVGGDAGFGGAAAGAGGAGGAAGAGGAGGANPCFDGDWDNCPFIDYCGPYALSELCRDEQRCPTIDELRNRGCSPGYERHFEQATSCGQVVVLDYGLGSEEFYFDAQGNLRSVLGRGDVAYVCKEGNGESAGVLWGDLPCERVGDVTELCGSGGDGAGGMGGAGPGGAAAGGSR